MKGLKRMKERLRNFMMGRYGVDQFGKFLLGLSLVLLIITMIIGGGFLYIISLLLIAYMYFRMFSRNHGKRFHENDIYMKYREKFFNIFRKGNNTIKQRKVYHIYRCPGCRQKIRIPRGKGRIQVTCPKCGTQFIKKS